jgi:hypothetical protein
MEQISLVRLDLIRHRKEQVIHGLHVFQTRIANRRRADSASDPEFFVGRARAVADALWIMARAKQRRLYADQKGRKLLGQRDGQRRRPVRVASHIGGRRFEYVLSHAAAARPDRVERHLGQSQSASVNGVELFVRRG